MCSCDVADECRKSSMDGMEECMKECQDEHLKVYGSHTTTDRQLTILQGYGDKTEEYRKCFFNNKDTIVEAENCLFDKKAD